MKGIIYKITNSVNGKVYVGQTIRTLTHRKYGHKQASKKRICSLYNAFNKYGFYNFIFEIIEEVDREKLDERERYWISFYNSMDKNYGYNLTSGGNLKKQLSEETKNKIRNNRPCHRPGYIAPNQGKVFSEEWLKNMKKPKNISEEQKRKNAIAYSIRFKGKKKSKIHRQRIAKSKNKPILQYDLKGNFIKEWSSILEACTFYKGSHSNIAGVLHNRQNTAIGYIWKFKNIKND